MEFSKKEQVIEDREELKVESKIISQDELLEIINRGGIEDTRFFLSEKGGVFKYFDINGANIHDDHRKNYATIQIKDKIVGLSELEQDPGDKNNYWVKSIDVDPEYQGKGYASMLIDKIFEFAKNNNYSLVISRYSVEGEERLKNKIKRTIQETGIKTVENS
jgi:GNAT superfamily N-acetyltransferase